MSRMNGKKTHTHTHTHMGVSPRSGATVHLAKLWLVELSPVNYYLGTLQEVHVGSVYCTIIRVSPFVFCPTPNSPYEHGVR